MLDSVKELFRGAAAKYLKAVDADPSSSNQHEIGGLPSVGFRQYLGTPGKADEYRFSCVMVYITDEDDPEICQDVVTWYDCRRHQPHRSAEYRLYYKDNVVTELIQPTDFFLIAVRHDGTLLLAFAPAQSSVEQQLRHLFGLSVVRETLTAASMPSKTLLLPIKLLLEAIGIDAFAEEEVQDDLQLLLERFPDRFPTTSVFSDLARETSSFDPITDPDGALVGWMDREETLFRAYERHVVGERLRAGFGTSGEDVDDFITFSLSVQNRRKSRVGHAFENHLGFIFESHRLQFEKGGALRVTENKAKPDFLFPSFEAYHDPGFAVERIFLLGAKTTCKDRWRQVLSEGDRVDTKYLATMEPGISAAQTDEMVNKKLQLVVPASIHATFSLAQREWLYRLSEFIEEVKGASS